MYSFQSPASLYPLVAQYKLLKLKTTKVVFTCLAILSLCISNAVAQSALQANQEQNNGFYFSVGYSEASYLNGGFVNSLQRGAIAKELGYVVDFQLIKLPFLLNAGFYANEFSSTALPRAAFPGETTIAQRGVEVGASVALFQDIKFLIPYAGVGYQSNSLTTYDDSESSREETVSSVPYEGMVLKLGSMLKFGRAFGLAAEYRRSLTLDGNKQAYNQFGVLASINISSIAEWYKNNAD